MPKGGKMGRRGLFHLGDMGTKRRQLLTLALAILALSGCLPIFAEPTPPPSIIKERSSPQTRNSTQIDSAGNVAIEVTWLGGPQRESRAPVRFRVRMDTHSVNLDSYDLAQLALLRNDAGNVLKPRSWDAPLGGHHRQGILEFGTEGKGIVGPGTVYLELVIRDVAGVPERVFRWPLR